MYKRILINNVALAAQYAVGGLIPLLMIPHIIRSIGLDQYGQIAIWLSVASYGAIVVQYAFQLTGPKQLAHLRPGESHKDIFLQIFGAKLILLFLVLIVFAAIVVTSEFSGARDSNAWFLLLLLLGAAFNSSWYLQSAERFLDAAFISVFAAMVSLAIGFGLVSEKSGMSVAAATISLVIGTFITGIGTLLSTLWHLRHQRGQHSFSASLNALRDNGTVFISQFTSAMYSASGPLVIGILVSKQAAGAYSAVERVANAIAAVCLLTHTAAYPRLALLYREQRQTYWKLMRFVFALYFACVLSILAVLILLGDMRERFLFGTTESGHAALIWWGMIWVLLAIFGAAITGYLTVSGRQHMVFPLTLKVLAISLVLGVPGVIYFGAWTWLASLATAQFLVLFEGFKALKNEFKQVKGHHELRT